MATQVESTFRKTAKAILVACLISVGISFAVPQGSSAQFAQPLPPYQAPPEGAPPPIGDGSTPLQVEPGDVQAPPSVPSGTADSTPGHNFPVGNGSDRTVVRIYRQRAGGATGQNRGEGMVQTIRPDQLSADQIGQINGILGINMLNGQQSQDVQASNDQIERIQNVLFPYPQAQDQGGKKFINSDAPAQGYPKAGQESSYDFQGPLPTVRTFCRYLVILGVVSATIWMALSMYAMVMGHPYGGARVVGSIAGFMLLLMGYTIWKIVQMNTFNAMSDRPAISQNRPNDAQTNQMNAPDLPPANPGAAGGRPNRSGVPVLPLYNAQNP